MNHKQQEEIARFRFGVISDLVRGVRLDPGEAAGIIRRKSQQRYNIPHSDRTRISEPTIRRWVRLYEKGGRKLTALYPGQRADRGKSRRVDEETIAALLRLRREKPQMPVNRLLAEMTAKNWISPGTTLYLSTAYRILQEHGLNRPPAAAKVDRRRFEAEFPNDIWQADVMHGPCCGSGRQAAQGLPDRRPG